MIKLRGAAQGPLALAAEVIVRELAQVLGLPVAEHVVVQIELPLRSDDHNDELADLVARSQGENLGIRWLERSAVLRPDQLHRIDDDFATRILWLDALVQNIDRTPNNPNILMQRGKPWLIDHGAALAFQYDWDSVTEDSPHVQFDLSSHLFHERRSLVEPAAAGLARLFRRDVLENAVATVPASFFGTTPLGTEERTRAAYIAYLWKRLKSQESFFSA